MVLLAKLVFVALYFVIWITFPQDIFASDNLLSNPDFEDFDGDIPKNWTKNYSTLTTSTTSTDSHSGNKAVLFQSSSNSTKYLYQIININRSASYQLSGWTKSISGSSDEYLRVTQCSDSSCTGEIKSDDSDHIQSSDWKNLTVSFTTVANASAIKVKISLDPQSASLVSAIWDDLSLIPTTQTFPSTPTPSPSITATPVPTSSNSTAINFSVPTNLIVASPFNISLTAENLPSATYFLKARLGPDDSHLTHGQTYNSSWLDDNDSWNKFPQITVDSSGNWSGNVTTQLPEGENAGSYKIQIRLKKTDKDTYYPSDLKDISFAQEQRIAIKPQRLAAQMSSNLQSPMP